MSIGDTPPKLLRHNVYYYEKIQADGKIVMTYFHNGMLLREEAPTMETLERAILNKVTDVKMTYPDFML